MGWLPLNGIWIGRNSGGVSAPSAPDAPTNLAAAVYDDDRIDLTWDAVTGADGYKIYYGTDGITFGSSTTSATNSKSVTGLTAGTLYYFYVTAYKGDNESLPSNTASDTTYYTNLMTTWISALKEVATNRASIAVIGDSITAGFITTDWEIDSYVSVLRNSLQSSYGNGGEGFMSAYHNYDPATTINKRWVYGPNWNWRYENSRTGVGAIASQIYNTLMGRTAQIDFTADTIQVMTGINHANGSYLDCRIDGTSKAMIDLRGDGISANLHYGNITTIDCVTNAFHRLLLVTIDHPVSNPDYAWFEGVRPLIGNSGVVVDRFGKGWVRADWLGNIEEANPANDYFEALKSCVDRFDEDLFIISLGINDYLNQVALNTFQTALTTITTRCKAVADVIIYAMPQPNSALTIPYSDYVSRMQTVAVAVSALFIDSRDVFGSAYKAAWMADDNHPNDTGHSQIATQIYNKIIL